MKRAFTPPPGFDCFFEPSQQAFTVLRVGVRGIQVEHDCERGRPPDRNVWIRRFPRCPVSPEICEVRDLDRPTVHGQFEVVPLQPAHGASPPVRDHDVDLDDLHVDGLAKGLRLLCKQRESKRPD